MRILIIEDDKDLTELMKFRLEKENFTVDVCHDGADNYMVKPFAFEELLARIRSIMRRPGKWGDLGLLKLGDISFDPECGRLCKDTKECTLSNTL